MRTYIQINPADNVVVAVKDLQTGVSLDINAEQSLSCRISLQAQSSLTGF